MFTRDRDYWVAGALLLVLLAASAWVLPVSLGPRVVLEPLLLSRGFALYTDVVDQHEPLLPLAASLLIRAGASPVAAARMTLLAIQALVLAGIFIAAGRVLPGRRWLALVLYGASLPLVVQGKLWYDMAMAPLLVMIVPLLLHDIEQDKAGWRTNLAGALLGLGFLVKQHALVAAGCVVGWLVLELGLQHALPRVARLLATFSVLPALHLIYRAFTDSLGSYLHWCWQINDRYLEVAALWPTSKQVLEILPLTALVILSLRLWRDRAVRLLAALGFGAASLAFPRYAHFHLAAALPMFALMAAAVVLPVKRKTSLGSRVTRYLAIALVALSARGWMDARFRQPVAEYDNLAGVCAAVRERLGGGSTIAVFPEDEATSNLYVQAGCLPPAYWMLTYPWYIDDAVQDRLIAGLARCELVVVFPGRDLQGRLPERYMSRYFSAIQREFPVAMPGHWEQGTFWICMRPKR